MHSNGRHGLAAVAAVGESRRVRCSAALVRRRSFGGTGVIAGATGEKLRVISAIGFSALVIRLRRSPIVADSPLSRSAARHFLSRHKTSSILVRVHLANMVERPNENRMSIAFPVEENSGMNGGNLVDPNRRCAVPEVEYQKNRRLLSGGGSMRVILASRLNAMYWRS